MDPDESDLWLLASPYFHQDWRLLDAGPEDVVVRFARKEGRDSAVHTAAEIRQLLARPASEDDLAQLWTTDYRAQFTPTRAGMTYREWFAQMLDILGRTPGDAARLIWSSTSPRSRERDDVGDATLRRRPHLLPG